MPLPHPAGAQPRLLPVSSLEAEQGPRNGGGIRGADSGTPSPPLPPGSASRQLSPGQDRGPKDEGPELCQSRAKAVSGRHSSVWFLAEFKSVGKKVVSSSPGRGSGQRGERWTEPGVDSGASGQTQRWTAPAPRRDRKGSRAPPHAAVPGLRAAGRPRRAGAGAGRAVQPAGFPRSHPRRSRGPGCGQLRSAQRRTKARLSPCRAAPQSFTYRAAHGGASAARPEPRPAGRPGTARPERGCLRRGREGQRPAPGAAGRDPPGTSRLCPALPGAPPPLSTLQSRSPRGTPKETAPSQLSGRAGNGSVSHRRELGSSGGRPGGAASLPQHPRHEHVWEVIPASASHRSLDGAARPAAAAPPGPARPPLAGLRLPPAGRSGERRAEPAAGPPLGGGGGSGAGLRPGGRVGGRGAWAAGVKVRGCGYKGKVRHRGGWWETGSRKSRCP